MSCNESDIRVRMALTVLLLDPLLLALGFTVPESWRPSDMHQLHQFSCTCGQRAFSATAFLSHFSAALSIGYMIYTMGEVYRTIFPKNKKQKRRINIC
jgi:hypothetical protein